MEPVRTYANLSVHTAEYVIAMRRYVFVSFSLVFVQIQFHLCCVMCSAISSAHKCIMLQNKKAPLTTQLQ